MKTECVTESSCDSATKHALSPMLYHQTSRHIFLMGKYSFQSGASNIYFSVAYDQLLIVLFTPEGRHDSPRTSEVHVIYIACY